MKFTLKNMTNQRIERITMKHAVVGIDIAKDEHAAQVTDFRGRTLTSRHLSFTNSQEGFEKFLRWVHDVQAKHRLKSLIVGMEPTGHYWFNIAKWFHQKGIEVVLVNPVTTHRNKENRDNSPSKSDPKDALTIADVVSRGFYTEYAPQEAIFERIKTMMSNREYWSKISNSLANRIVRWIDLYFPEFRQVFPDWTTLRSLSSLRAFPLPSDLQGLSADEVIQSWRDNGMKRAGGTSGRTKAVQLLLAAKRSIGDTKAKEEARQDLKRLLDAYEDTIRYLDEFERKVAKLLDTLPMTEQLRSIGLGTITIAVLFGCAGDLRLYAHGRQLLRLAGLNLAECTSGRYKGQIKLSKRGNSMLRKYLYLAMVSLVGQHRDFKRWHEQNQQKGMTKMASLFKLIGKLARIMIGIIRRGETYRSELHLAA